MSLRKLRISFNILDEPSQRDPVICSHLFVTISILPLNDMLLIARGILPWQGFSSQNIPHLKLLSDEFYEMSHTVWQLAFTRVSPAPKRTVGEVLYYWPPRKAILRRFFKRYINTASGSRALELYQRLIRCMAPYMEPRVLKRQGGDALRNYQRRLASNPSLYPTLEETAKIAQSGLHHVRTWSHSGKMSKVNQYHQYLVLQYRWAQEDLRNENQFWSTRGAQVATEKTPIS